MKNGISSGHSIPLNSISSAIMCTIVFIWYFALSCVYDIGNILVFCNKHVYTEATHTRRHSVELCAWACVPLFLKKTADIIMWNGISLSVISVLISTIKSIKRENGDFHEMIHIAFKSKVISQFVFNDCECERIHTCIILYVPHWHFFEYGISCTKVRSDLIESNSLKVFQASHQMDGRRLHTWTPKTDRNAMYDF